MYDIQTTARFDKEFKKLDKQVQRLLKAWIVKNLTNVENPRSSGKALVGNLRGMWRYRIGDYRLICLIEDDKLVLTALSVGHRRDIYR